ncbi:hypothetical protein [Streptomyces sp. NPDC085479]|uniref:hypothetical protein n=1 Tax=Streptomyces sp. NPDC085479 TaxID=3365726 RepID=UPI0037D2922B
MASPALTAALRRVDAVFGGMTAPADGCAYCYGEDGLAPLAVPGALLGDDLLGSVFHEVPDHFADHAAVVRRILPEVFAVLADGRFSGMGFMSTGLGRVAWREWPAEQASAIEGFLDVWWRETLADPAPVHGVNAVWELSVDFHQAVAPLLDAWAAAPRGGIEDRHLADFADQWVQDLLTDYVIGWPADESLLLELQAWLVEHVPDRLAGHPDPLLARKVALLPLGEEERYAAYLELIASAG